MKSRKEVDQTMALFTRLTSAIGCSLCTLIIVTTCPVLASDANPVRCGPFMEGQPAGPEPREAASVVQRFEDINEKVRSHSYQVVFLGDSLTQRWDEVPEDNRIWAKNFDRFHALNAGINGDRTDHLLWRIEHGNLANQRPRALVLLIGTNDLGHGLAPEETAEGIRQILMKLRQTMPDAKILLEGLWPRSDRGHFAAEIDSVNRRIKQCADGVRIIYADPGRVLADSEGRLRRDLAPDGLHPNPAGYAIISPEIVRQLDRLLAER